MTRERIEWEIKVVLVVEVVQRRGEGMPVLVLVLVHRRVLRLECETLVVVETRREGSVREAVVVVVVVVALVREQGSVPVVREHDAQVPVQVVVPRVVLEEEEDAAWAVVPM